ncbi:helix-turn-helix domain-containing protein [Halalkalibacter urbisdiaboli]|uniref:helix-turn-helix domain-containing protein n=1 Tax=Halalkalibacter urbisdiaboli TaxID=1960589 RepID=UPI000B4347F9|nr:helix-turn-helix transcriptional regulator [Halalkalibacter urbisdiaboli]
MPKGKISKIIGERLRKLRKEQGLSQEELAHKAFLHPTYIGQLERGEKNPTVETVEKVANALQISLADLFRFSTTNENDVIDQLMVQLHSISKEDQETLMKVVSVLLEWKDRTK